MDYKIINNNLIIKIDSEVNLCSFLIDLCINQKKINDMFNKKRIMINDNTVNKDTLLKKNDVLKIALTNENIDYAMDDKELKVIYEDDLVLVVHKDKGIIVHDDDKTKHNTLCNIVAFYYQEKGYNIPVRFIHRLDKETSGLIMFSKVSLLQPYFDKMLLEKQIKRYYKAIVKGRINKQEIIIDEPIGKDRHHNNKYLVLPSGKEAKTKITVIETNKDYSLVECELFTGRTHQIRVHLAYINHPIVNDEIYGTSDNEYTGMGLYAYKLIYQDPFTKKPITIIDNWLNNIHLK